MTEKENESLLRRDLKKVMKKTSKNDVLLTFDQIYSSTPIKSIPIDLIADSLFLKNAPVSAKSLQITLNSVKLRKDVNPILLREIKENEYEIVVGRRRFYAYKSLGYEYINAIVTNLSDEDALFCMLSNSLDKNHKNILEQATLLKYLKENFNYSLTELSKISGVSISQICNLLRVLNLNENVIKAISEDSISLGQAKCFCMIPNEYQNTVLERVLKDNLSVKDTEKLCKSLINNNANQKNESLITEKFSAKNVTIKSTSFEIKFKSKSKLNEFIKRLKNLE